MFNPISAAMTSVQLEKLLQSGLKEDGEAGKDFLKLLRSSGHVSVSPELRELLAFATGYFSKSIAQGGEIANIASAYCAMCADIANGHIEI